MSWVDEHGDQWAELRDKLAKLDLDDVDDADTQAELEFIRSVIDSPDMQQAIVNFENLPEYVQETIEQTRIAMVKLVAGAEASSDVGEHLSELGDRAETLNQAFTPTVKID